MGKAKKEEEKRTLEILAVPGDGDGSDGAGEGRAKIQCNELHARHSRIEHGERREALQGLDERSKKVLLPPAASSGDEDGAIVSKKEAKKVKSKEFRPEESPGSWNPDKDEQTREEDETDAKRKSTRSGRRKRRNVDLKMSAKRRQAYGMINPKRPKSN